MMHCSKRIFWLLPSAPVTSMTCGLANLPVPCTTSTLRCFASTDRPPTSLPDDAVLPLEQLGQVDRRRAEVDAVAAHLADFVDDLGRVQQRLRGNAAHVEADAAQHRPAFDERDLESEIGGAERGGVTAGTGAEHQQLRFAVVRNVGLERPGGFRRGRGGCARCAAAAVRRWSGLRGRRGGLRGRGGRGFRGRHCRLRCARSLRPWRSCRPSAPALR